MREPLRTELIRVDCLLNFSKMAIENVMLKNLTDSRNSKKEAVEALERLIEQRAAALLAQWFLHNGDELMALASGDKVLPPISPLREDGERPTVRPAMSADEVRRRIRRCTR